MVGKVARSYFFSQDPFQQSSQRAFLGQRNDQRFLDRKTICIISANNSKEMSQAAQGIVSAMMDLIEYPHIIPVIGDNNVKELTALFCDVLDQHSNIDIIFSIGESSTKIAQKITQERGGKIPVFFTLVDEKVVSHSMIMKSGNNVTGAVGPSRDYTDQFKPFFYFTQYDRTKKILVPHSRLAHGLGGAHLSKEGPSLISFLATQQVEAELVDITCNEDLYTKIKQSLSNVALLAIPRDTILEAYADEFIAMANERHIPLFSSSLESIEQGAAVGFGSSGRAFAKRLALLAKPILVDGIHPSKIPLIKINDWVGTIGINREAAAKQGLQLNMERVCADENVVLLS